MGTQEKDWTKMSHRVGVSHSGVKGWADPADPLKCVNLYRMVKWLNEKSGISLPKQKILEKIVLIKSHIQLPPYKNTTNVLKK